MPTLTFRLENELLQVLDQLARSAGSRTQALRILLEEARQRLDEAEMEKAYQAYFSDPTASEAERCLTQAMLLAVDWPDEENQ